MTQRPILSSKARQIGAGGSGKTKEKNKPGNLDLGLAVRTPGASGQPRHVGRRKQRNRNDPQGACQFHRGTDSERLVAVPGSSANHGAGVVDGKCGPKPKLILAQLQSMANRGEGKQGDGVEHEDRSHGNTNLFLIRTGDGGDGGDRASTADGGARGDQKGRLSGNLK